MGKYNIYTNKVEEIKKRSVGVSLKFRILNWILMTFFKDWTIVKDIIVIDAKSITTKNMAPVFGSFVNLKTTGTLSICTPAEFKKEAEKSVKR